MIPIECPECHSDNWHLLQSAKDNKIRNTMCTIREETDIQTDFIIVEAICNECGSMFWMSETQADCIIEEFA